MAQRNTTPELPVYIAERSIEDIGRQHGATINVYVHGFWSDVITIYVRRDWRWSKDESIEHQWKIEVTHSSGGRDTDMVADDVLAHEYFAMGVMAACLEARRIRSHFTELERFALLADEKAQIEREAEKAAEQAAIDADPAMGEEKAAALLAEAAAKTTRRDEITIVARHRGASRQVTKFYVKQGRDGVNRFFKGGAMAKRIDIIAALATYAADSYISV